MATTSEEYQNIVQDFLCTPGEDGLEKAHSFARRAIGEGLTISDFAQLHDLTVAGA